ncbi:MAG: hypothetical protein LBD60_00460 [Puniceicoccales bacterium]|jgi:hypothetical protein|nr:hypothetical protein [Puniceicoccales bacterium]
MKTLHEKFIRTQTEQFLKKIGCCVPLSDDEEPEEEVETAPIALEDLEQTVMKTVEETEQFFAHFGLTPERQEELFQMPIIRESLDEIIAGVARERVELELEFGAPRNGWDPLPFEKSEETEKILKKLMKRTKEEKIKAVHVDTIFDQSAQEQIAAIQKRLSAALEEVKNAAQEQKKAMTLPALPVAPRRESLVEAASAVALSDLQEKRSIDADFKRHYAEQLKVVISPQNPQAIPEAHPSPQNEAQLVDQQEATTKDLQTQTENGQPSKSPQVRTVEAITKDIEKMRFGSAIKAGQQSEPSMAAEEVLSPEVVADEEMPKILRKVPTTRTNGVIISALKSKIQKGEHPAVITEDMELRHQDVPAVNLFEGGALPGLPLYGNASSGTGDSQEGEGKSKTLLTHRRQMGPRRFQL